MQGVFETSQLLTAPNYHPVLAAATISFGFVFIHPFVDGNGRLHRYLMHHTLAKNGFAPKGAIFPISASILSHLVNYRSVLEHFSHRILPFIRWESSTDNNIIVLNDTADFYRYFDATLQAEFMFDCIADTIDRIIPQEVKYLMQYDAFKQNINQSIQLPKQQVSLLVKLLGQNKGLLSKNKREGEFSELSDQDVERIEGAYKRAFEI
jgi:Fic family protein